MLSISPTSADIVTAVPTAENIFALPGCRYDEKPAGVGIDAGCDKIAKAEVKRARRRERNVRIAKHDIFALFNGRLDCPRRRSSRFKCFDIKPPPAPPQQLLTPDDIVCDWPTSIPYEYHAPVKRFEHTPTVTYRSGDKTVVITGPIEPTIPHMTEATRLGWEKWHGDRAAHLEAAIKDSQVHNAQRKAYFQARKDKKDADWDAKCERALAKGKPLPKRPKYREPPPDFMNYVKDETLVRMVASARYMRDKSKRLCEYKHNGGGVPFAGRIYAPFQESFDREDGEPAPAIRSWQGPISLALFNSALPRNLSYGYDKEIEYSISETGAARIFVLDYSHVVLDKYRRCAFIVDLDGWWPSIKVLRSHLRKLLPPEFMPNLITYCGAEDGKGGVENPHLVWMLPPGARVIWKGQGKKKQQFRLHSMVQAGIVSLLIPLGADPGHTNAFKTKNPLSPGYSVEVCDDYFQTMEDWRGFLPTITPNKREMQRRAKINKASQQSGEKVEESQAIWNDGKNLRRLEIAAAQHRKDPAFLAARKRTKTFVEWLYHRGAGVVTKRLIDAHGDTRAVRSVLRAQRQFVVDLDMTPSAIGEWCDRGRDRDLNADEFKPLPTTATKEQREARAKLIRHLARQRTQANKEMINCGLICEEIESRMAAGIQVIKSEVVNALVKAGTVKRSTAYNHFDRCLEIVQLTARYQGTSSTVSEQSSQQIEATPVMSESVSVNETTESNPKESQANVAPVRNPAKTSSQTRPSWVVDKDTFIIWDNACWIRDEWSMAVARWRKAKQQQPAADVDLVKDEKFRAMVLDRYAWSHRRH
jgi:hypothetical protein